ncbi:MAG: hypothetical protein K2X03_26050 [Bryobacteraceae bacterium]|nr:hypothetical protein [Bryobacteraceae bacterium]
MLSLCSLPLLSADLLPLATGNQWTYRLSDGTSRSISVGLPLAAGGRVYYRVNGYAAVPLWLRTDAKAIYFYDDETERDQELLRFATGPSTTMISGCEQSAESARAEEPYQGPAGRFESPLRVQFRPLACRDVGFESDVYLDNIGLARRVESTLAGLRTMELTYAKVGALTLEPGRKTTLSLALEPDLKATLRLTVADGEALRLAFNSSQRYDLAIRDTNGVLVYLWSATAIFLPVTGTEVFGGTRTWQIDTKAAGLLPGQYQVEAWITHTGDRKLTVITPLTVPPN